MTTCQRALLDAAAVAVAVRMVWAPTRHHHPRVAVSPICGAELGTESAADEPWVCVRPPHPDTADHRALDGSTWRE
jgi:hypothetical protein